MRLVSTLPRLLALATVLPACAQHASYSLDGDTFGGPTPPDFLMVDLLVPDLTPVTGLFYPASHYTAGAKPEAIVAGDWNGDGKPDIAAANVVGYVSVLLNAGTGNLMFPERYTAGDTPTAIASGDWNGDKKPDLAVANANDGTVTLLFNTGDGRFGKQASPDGGAPPNNIAAGQTPVSIVAADFTNDGKIDLVVANRDVGTVTLLPGKGDGTFDTPRVTMAGVAPRSLAAGDWDGDGNLDLAVANGFDKYVNVLRGNGGGFFAAPVPFASGTTPVFVTTADVNGDKKPDLIALNFGDNTATVLLGKGDGTFTPMPSFMVDQNPAAVAAGDLDADSIPDLAIVSGTSLGVSVYSGKGDGTFGAAMPFSTVVDATRPPVPDWVVLTDMNGDGKLDVVVSDFEQSDAAVLINNTK